MVAHIMEGLSGDAGELLERNNFNFFPLIIYFVLYCKRNLKLKIKMACVTGKPKKRPDS